MAYKIPGVITVINLKTGRQMRALQYVVPNPKETEAFWEDNWNDVEDFVPDHVRWNPMEIVGKSYIPSPQFLRKDKWVPVRNGNWIIKSRKGVTMTTNSAFLRNYKMKESK